MKEIAGFGFIVIIVIFFGLNYTVLPESQWDERRMNAGLPMQVMDGMTLKKVEWTQCSPYQGRIKFTRYYDVAYSYDDCAGKVSNHEWRRNIFEDKSLILNKLFILAGAAYKEVYTFPDSRTLTFEFTQSSWGSSPYENPDKIIKSLSYQESAALLKIMNDLKTIMEAEGIEVPKTK